MLDKIDFKTGNSFSPPIPLFLRLLYLLPSPSGLSCPVLLGKGAELVLDGHNLVRSFIGSLDYLAVLVGDIVFDIQNL